MNVVFYLLGDMGSGDESQLKVSNAMKQNMADKKKTFVLGLGDNIYEKGCESSNDSQFMTKFEEPYSRISDKIKFYMLLGNHDYRGNINAQLSYAKKSKERGGKWVMDSTYYVPNTNTSNIVEFFIIDSNMDDLSEESIQKQLKYMKNKIHKSTATWKVVNGHHTWRSIAGHGNAEPRLESFLMELFRDAPFDVYMCGHDHNKQIISTTINNVPVTMIVCGTGGKAYHDTNNLENLDNIHDLEFVSNNLGFGRCSATKKHLDVSFFDGNNDEEYKYRLEK